ncbi:hypothetical protein NBRC116583_19320 [Arenicella sp. 4NH20-0111]|uniref:hypothetical protein n=1 Tax=Arenicella sp. 4NH20-0111 TaxID=3127648 RepID=UPI00310386BC
MAKEIIIAIVSSILGALVAFLASSSLGLFEKELSDTQVRKIASIVVNEKNHRNVILDNMDASGNFKGPQGRAGPQGIQGIPGPGIKALAILTVKNGNIEYSSSGVTYDKTSGIVEFPNPDNLNVLPIVSDLGSGYMTSKHYIRQDFTIRNKFKIWRTTLDTGDRNSEPASFTAIAVGF